jgi:hypothetical protein
VQGWAGRTRSLSWISQIFSMQFMRYLKGRSGLVPCARASVVARLESTRDRDMSCNTTSLMVDRMRACASASTGALACGPSPMLLRVQYIVLIASTQACMHQLWVGAHRTGSKHTERRMGASSEASGDRLMSSDAIVC